mgnify:CR=1 FL=1
MVNEINYPGLIECLTWQGLPREDSLIGDGLIKRMSEISCPMETMNT